MKSTDTTPEPIPAVIAPECTKGHCRDCYDDNSHPCEHNCHPPHPKTSTPLAEVHALGTAHDALKDLDPNAQERALRWLTARLRGDRPGAFGAHYDEEPPF